MGWIAILLSLVQLGMQVFPECGLQVDKAEPLACLLAVAFLLSHPPGQELVLGRTTCLEKGHLACWLQSCRPTSLQEIVPEGEDVGIQSKNTDASTPFSVLCSELLLG